MLHFPCFEVIEQQGSLRLHQQPIPGAQEVIRPIRSPLTVKGRKRIIADAFIDADVPRRTQHILKLLIRSSFDPGDAVQTFRKHFDQCGAAAVGKQCADHAVFRDKIDFRSIGGNKAQDLPFDIPAAEQSSVPVKAADAAAQGEIKIVLLSAEQQLARLGTSIGGKRLPPPFLSASKSVQAMPDLCQAGHAPGFSHRLLFVCSQKIKITLCIETEAFHPAIDRIEPYKRRGLRLKNPHPVFKRSDAAAIPPELYGDLSVVRGPAELRDILVRPLRQRQAPDLIALRIEQQNAVDVAGRDHRTAVIRAERTDRGRDRCTPVFFPRPVVCRHEEAVFDKAEQCPVRSLCRRHGHRVSRYAEDRDFFP